MTEKKAPAISVIMPVYNVEKYVEQSLRSVLDQQFKDFELIVVDDCSTDRSTEIIENIISSTQGGGNKAQKLCQNSSPQVQSRAG